MQIQRIQSLWLLFAAICGGLSLCLPWLSTAEADITPLCSISLLIPSALAVILALASIFMYRNMRRQKQVIKVGVMFMGCSWIIAGVLSHTQGAAIAIGGPVIMAVAAVFAIMAISAIRRDEKLLRSADRLR
jgi:drug/metabolite transporter (DMT)-like permease